MTELSAAFSPDWVSPPRDTLWDAAEERSWTQAELALRLGYTEKHMSQLINGKVPLSMDAALRLERVLGSSADFWLSREAKYQHQKARLEAAERHATWTPWLDELPVKELMAHGAIPKQRMDAKNKPDLVEACLRFFGVASPTEWRAHYGHMHVAFRRSRAEQSNVGAIAAWLRLGEQQSEKVEAPKYDKARFEKALQHIRTLTCEAPHTFEPQMRQHLQEAGVMLVWVPAMAGTHVSGVARWLSPTRPLIQLSLYGKTNDKFWFSFFHEAAHIQLHANNKEDKKSIFLDDPNATHSNDPQEHEANVWARDWLIPAPYAHALASLRTKAAVQQFAQQVGIHPGIVVGRLQFDQYIDPSWMNDLKVSYSIQSPNQP
jgi:HTH-type transcriptional regulator / antitoxin HigA